MIQAFNFIFVLTDNIRMVKSILRVTGYQLKNLSQKLLEIFFALFQELMCLRRSSSSRKI